jgi:hypothetical protein
MQVTTDSDIKKLINYLDHVILDNDQPTTCPKCGCRTEDDHLMSNKQINHCTHCHYTFIGIFE